VVFEERQGWSKKKIATAGSFCPNENCEYYGIRDEQTHVLVGYGRHGLYEEIRDFKCQACGKKFTGRRNTVLYRAESCASMPLEG
jgi:transposase-like protein